MRHSKETFIAHARAMNERDNPLAPFATHFPRQRDEATIVEFLAGTCATFASTDVEYLTDLQKWLVNNLPGFEFHEGWGGVEIDSASQILQGILEFNIGENFGEATEANWRKVAEAHAIADALTPEAYVSILEQIDEQAEWYESDEGFRRDAREQGLR